MSEKIEDLGGEQSLDAIRAEAKILLAEIKKLRTQAEDQFKAAEASRKGADEHASYANQAKINTENHSKATAVFKGTAESDQNSIASNKQKSDELLNALTRAKTDTDADAKAINDRRKEVDLAALDFIKTVQTGASHLQEIVESKNSTDALVSDLRQSRRLEIA